jgi:flagellar motor switch protein FliN/FliY
VDELLENDEVLNAAEELLAAQPADGDGILAEVPASDLSEVALGELASPGQFATAGDLAPVLDVPVELSVEIGRTTMTIGETLAIGPGSIVSLNRAIGEPVDLLVNGKRIARGEVVAVDEEFGLRVTEVDPHESRLEAI